jgi:metal-sulfur cluster biosynthetic enzyme
MADTVTDAQVLSALGRVRAPDPDTDVVSLGFARDLAIEGGRVGFPPVVARLSVHALRRSPWVS